LELGRLTALDGFRGFLGGLSGQRSHLDRVIAALDFDDFLFLDRIVIAFANSGDVAGVATVTKITAVAKILNDTCRVQPRIIGDCLLGIFWVERHRFIASITRYSPKLLIKYRHLFLL